MKCDLHVHTHYSIDSTETMENHCKRAIQLDLDCICFTDHVDYNPNDIGFGYYKVDDYFNEFNRMKDKYGDKLTILSGIEIGEPHIYKKELDELLKYPYDFVIASLHWWYSDMFPSEMVKHNIPVETCYEHYWTEMYNMVSYGGFDSVGHFDFPKRYYKKLLYNEAELKDIFMMIEKNNLLIEINTSSLRKGLSESMPNDDILKLYRAKYYTTGSDAHSADELFNDIDKISISNKNQVYFKDRKMIL